MVENAKNAKKPFFDPPAPGSGAPHRNRSAIYLTFESMSTNVRKMRRKQYDVSAVAGGENRRFETLSLRSAETDGRADLAFEPNEGVMVY